MCNFDALRASIITFCSASSSSEIASQACVADCFAYFRLYLSEPLYSIYFDQMAKRQPIPCIVTVVTGCRVSRCGTQINTKSTYLR